MFFYKNLAFDVKVESLVDAIADMHATLLELDVAEWRPLFKNRFRDMEAKFTEAITGVDGAGMAFSTVNNDPTYAEQSRRLKKFFVAGETVWFTLIRDNERIYEEEIGMFEQFI